MLSSLKTHHLIQWLVTICLMGLVVALPVRPVPVWAGSQSTIPNPETLAGCGGPTFASSSEAFEQEVVRLTNQIRRDNDLPPLKLMWRPLIQSYAALVKTDEGSF